MAHEKDKALIESLGGPAKVAELLGYPKEGGVQRVQNWTARGIPASVKLEHPDIFLRDLTGAVVPWDGVNRRGKGRPAPKAKKVAKKGRK